MTDAKKPASSPDSLTKTGKGAGVALNEEQLKKVSGGQIDAHKATGGLKIDTSFHK